MNKNGSSLRDDLVGALTENERSEREQMLQCEAASVPAPALTPACAYQARAGKYSEATNRFSIQLRWGVLGVAV